MISLQQLRPPRAEGRPSAAIRPQGVLQESAHDSRFGLAFRLLAVSVDSLELRSNVREFGANSIHVARRMRAMLEDPIRRLPPGRASVLRQELDLLKS